MKAFDFPIYGYECEEYCYALVDRHGENSAIVKLLDANYERLAKKNHAYIERLNEIRKFLSERGFEKEVAEQDAIFLDSIKNRPRKKPVPMAERWGQDYK